MRFRRKINSLQEQVSALKLVERDYTEVLEHATEVIFRLDPEGHFQFVSSEFVRLLGYSKQEIQGRHFTTILHAEDVQHCMETFGVLTEFGKAKSNISFRVRCTSGEYRWVDCSAVCLFNERAQPQYIIGFAHDVTELYKLVEELRNSEKALAAEYERYIQVNRMISGKVIDVQEKERADIGYELQDNVNQILSTARLHLELARQDEKNRLELMERSVRSIADAASEVLRLSRLLIPPSLGEIGLVRSIEDLVDSIRSTQPINAEFCCTGDPDHIIDEKLKLAIFRIIQEQTANVLKHAGASRLTIELAFDKQSVDLSVSDDGKGFDMENIRKGTGMDNISNRVESFAGRLRFVTSPEMGCKLNIHIPVKP